MRICDISSTILHHPKYIFPIFSILVNDKSSWPCSLSPKPWHLPSLLSLSHPFQRQTKSSLHLYVSQFWSLPPISTTTILIQATINSCLSYFSCRLIVLPVSSLTLLSSFLHIATRIILYSHQSGSIPPTPKALQWLPITLRRPWPSSWSHAASAPPSPSPLLCSRLPGLLAVCSYIQHTPQGPSHSLLLHLVCLPSDLHSPVHPPFSSLRGHLT